ncbi:MAG TPA: cell division protein SepF [Jiangellaceae bacterium]|nr:cell division protein SepF [Jiangellaceae bacterium]
MAGAMRKVAVYLGLVEDRDRYEDDYDDYDDEGYPPEMGEGYDEPPAPAPEPSPARAERTATVASLDDRRTSTSSSRRPHEVKITTLHPRTYNEARTLGEHFRDGTPVIMNLSEMDDVDAKRLVDFAAGLIFGLRGSIDRITAKVFLLSPADVHVTAEDKAKIAGAGGAFFNQS